MEEGCPGQVTLPPLSGWQVTCPRVKEWETIGMEVEQIFVKFALGVEAVILRRISLEPKGFSVVVYLSDPNELIYWTVE